MLAPHHQEMLSKDSGISDDVITARGYKTVETRKELRELGFGEAQSKCAPALVIPIWDVRGEKAFHIMRPDNPRTLKTKPTKYENPAGAKIVLDVHPHSKPNLGNPEIPLYITEGSKKVDALVSRGCCAIGVMGVWGWRCTNGAGGKTALPDWESIALNDRKVYLVFDSDAMEKKEVHLALVRLKAFLESRDTKVMVVYLPQLDGLDKVGVDDFFVRGHTVDDIKNLASKELRPLPREPDTSCPYEARESGIVWNKRQQDETVPVQLSNFQARIVADIEYDDGANHYRIFTIEAKRGAMQRVFDVPAASFPSLAWANEHLGSAARIYPTYTARERLRDAILALSDGEAETRSTFGHLGWRQIDGQWVYLHHGGGIGAGGLRDDISVTLPGALSRYGLPEPPQGDDLQENLLAVLELMNLCKPELMTPLLGSVFRSVLRRADYGVFLPGKTGLYKSELSALMQQFFGAEMNAAELPTNWESTALSLVSLAFKAKDTLMVVDDYVPSVGNDLSALNRKAELLFRGSANNAGRERLRSTLEHIEAQPPRGMILSTGEDLPAGQSLRSRIVFCEMEQGGISTSKLSACQAAARQGRYAGTMAAFLQWLAPRYGDIQEMFDGERNALRSLAYGQAFSHNRIPGNIASCAMGWLYFLRFAVDMDCIPLEKAETMWRGAWKTLLKVGAAQSAYVAEADPVERFLSVLEQALLSGEAHLANLDGGPPDEPGVCGWKSVGDDYQEQWEARGDKIGWLDADGIYLMPDMVFSRVQRLATGAGDPLNITKNTMWKRLNEAGKLASTDGKRETLKVRKSAEGKRPPTIHLKKFGALLSGKPDQPDQSPKTASKIADWSGFLPPLVGFL